MRRKINVHFVFAPDTVTALRRMNAQVRAFTPSLIVFDETSPHIPHVSLQMGTTNTDADLAPVAAAVEAVARRNSRRDLVLLRPYLENVRNHYVFCDVANAEAVVDVRQELERALHGYLTVQDDYAEIPHVTVAHIDVDHTSIAPVLAQFPDHLSATVSVIEISDTGPKGTCVNPLYSYALS
jgi:2'-5' RNA ligase superfamily